MPNKESQEGIELEEILELLGVDSVPGDEADIRFLRRSTQRLINRYGKEWIEENRVRLLAEYEQILEM